MTARARKVGEEVLALELTAILTSKGCQSKVSDSLEKHHSLRVKVCSCQGNYDDDHVELQMSFRDIS